MKLNLNFPDIMGLRAQTYPLPRAIFLPSCRGVRWRPFSPSFRGGWLWTESVTPRARLFRYTHRCKKPRCIAPVSLVHLWRRAAGSKGELGWQANRLISNPQVTRQEHSRFWRRILTEPSTVWVEQRPLPLRHRPTHALCARSALGSRLRLICPWVFLVHPPVRADRNFQW